MMNNHILITYLYTPIPQIKSKKSTMYLLYHHFKCQLDNNSLSPRLMVTSSFLGGTSHATWPNKKYTWNCNSYD